MNFMLTYPRDDFKKNKLKSSDIQKFIKKHESNMKEAIQKLLDYYEGKHEILSKERNSGLPNSKAVCNHAKDIADTASGYFLGNPITYSSKRKESDEMVKTLSEALELSSATDVDQENALLLSIVGRAYELVYVAEGEAELRISSIDPLYTFIVYDETIEHRELFGVYYYRRKSDIESGENPKLYVSVYTDTERKDYVLEGDEDKDPVETVTHNLGSVPIIEYKNNKFCIGDFEQQMSLIDAYNTLTSDRINDKEQFIDAILVIYGQILGDTEEESAEAQKKLKKKKLLELDTDSRAEYLTRTLDENGMEVLRKALKEDIYTFSHVPNLTDENFAGNSSGVAMEYKLLGLEMLTKIKERWYRKGLRKRLRLFIHYMNLKASNIDINNVEVVFSRSLPKNLLELSQIIENLSGKVSDKKLISLLPFVENPDEEVEEVKKQAEENIKRQQELFSQQQSIESNELPKGDDEQ